MVNRDGLIVEKSQAGVLYANDVCLIASNEQDLQRIFDSISGCISEYGIKLVKQKSKVICIHGVKKERMWHFCGSQIGEVEGYKYLGVKVKAGLNGGFKCRIEWHMQMEYLVWSNMQQQALQGLEVKMLLTEKDGRVWW